MSNHTSTDENHHTPHVHHHHASGNIKTAFFLNLGFTIVELVGGILTNSTAILADAVHDLGDSFALGQAWYFEKKSHQKSDDRYTYGYQRFSLFAALLNIAILFGGSLVVLVNAVPRLFTPHQTNAQGMLLLALLGIAINALAMIKVSKEHSMNAKIVALHMLEDVLGWIAVLVVSIILHFYNLPILDPILAILITLYILFRSIQNLQSIVPVFLQAVPDALNINTITQQIEALENIRSAHHVHIWSLDGKRNVFTAHLEVGKLLTPMEYQQLKTTIQNVVAPYHFHHSTIEIEFPGEICRNSVTP